MTTSFFEVNIEIDYIFTKFNACNYESGYTILLTVGVLIIPNYLYSFYVEIININSTIARNIY